MEGHLSAQTHLDLCKFHLVQIILNNVDAYQMENGICRIKISALMRYRSNHNETRRSKNIVLVLSVNMGGYELVTTEK